MALVGEQAERASAATEREALLDRVRRVAAEAIAPQADLHDREGTFPRDSMAALHAAGLMGLALPRAYGGLGGDINGDQLLFHHSTYEIARACGSTALVWGHHGYIAALVAQLGTEAQKRHYFGRVVRDGAFFASIGSEPRGKEPFALGTTARPVAGGYVLNGTKRFGSAMGHATFHVIWAMLEGERDPGGGLILAVVEPDQPGVEIIRNWTSMGMRGSATDGMKLTECFVAEDAIVGAPGALFTLPLQPLLFQTEFAANFTGLAAGALDFALSYVRQHARPWAGVERASEDPYTQYRLGEMIVARESALASVERAAHLAEQARDSMDERDLRAAAVAAWSAKAIATEAAKQITNTAFQVCGARSSRRLYNLDRYWRDSTTFSLHDPVDYRYQAVGDLVLNEKTYQAGIF